MLRAAPPGVAIGLECPTRYRLLDMPALVEPGLHRPKRQRWMALRGLERKMAEYRPPRHAAE